MESVQIGYLLRSSTTNFTVGCSVPQLVAPTLGALVRVPLDGRYNIYGLIYDIHIEDDGLVRQLVTAGNISREVILDNRERRIVPVEMSALAVGYADGEGVSHLLPPRPALSLDEVFLCSDAELIEFTGSGKFGYFRHILEAGDLAVGEVLAAHIRQAGEAQRKKGNQRWMNDAIQELIILLRDDYPTLMSVLGSLNDILPGEKT
jgi:hypothetical protein